MSLPLFKFQIVTLGLILMEIKINCKLCTANEDASGKI